MPAGGCGHCVKVACLLPGLFALLHYLVGDLLWCAMRESRLRDWQSGYFCIGAMEQLTSLTPGRIRGVKCLPRHLNRTHGLSDVRRYDAVDPEPVLEPLKLACDSRITSPGFAKTCDLVPALHDLPDGPAFHPVLHLLNARYLISRSPPSWPLPIVIQEQDYWVSPNPTSLPRALIPRSVQRVADSRQALDSRIPKTCCH